MSLNITTAGGSASRHSMTVSAALPLLSPSQRAGAAPSACRTSQAIW